MRAMTESKCVFWLVSSLLHVKMQNCCLVVAADTGIIYVVKRLLEIC